MNSYQSNLCFLTLAYVFAIVAPLGLDHVLKHFGTLLFWGVRFATLLMSKSYLIKDSVKYAPMQAQPFQWKKLGFIVLCIFAGVSLLGLISTMFGKDPVNVELYAAVIGYNMSSDWRSKTIMLIVIPTVKAVFYQFFMFRDFSTYLGFLPGTIFTAIVAGILDPNHGEAFTFTVIDCAIYHFLGYHTLALLFLIVFQSGLNYVNSHIYHSFHISLLEDAMASRSRRALFLENLLSYGENNNFVRGVIKATSKLPSEIRDNYIDKLKAESGWAAIAHTYMSEAMQKVGNVTSVF